MKSLIEITLHHLALYSRILGLTLASIQAAQAAEQPNIIYVMTDDQGYGDLACHGHSFIKTPHLDKLYAQSSRFTDYHVSPTCAPSMLRNPSRLPLRNKRSLKKAPQSGSRQSFREPLKKSVVLPSA